jgi:hypothetical protein
MSLILASCAGSGIDSRAVDSSESVLATEPASQESVAHVQEVEISSFVDETVCRRESPTGSRIAVNRCYSRGQAEDADAQITEYITRQDIEQLRQQQIYQQQVQQARDRAMRQRSLGQ